MLHVVCYQTVIYGPYLVPQCYMLCVITIYGTALVLHSATCCVLSESKDQLLCFTVLHVTLRNEGYYYYGIDCLDRKGATLDAQDSKCYYGTYCLDHKGHVKCTGEQVLHILSLS